MSLSEYLRLRLLHPGKLRRVSTPKAKGTMKNTRENAWCVPEGENPKSYAAWLKPCIHGYRSFANGATQCPVCRKFGLQMGI